MSFYLTVGCYCLSSYTFYFQADEWSCFLSGRRTWSYFSSLLFDTRLLRGCGVASLQHGPRICSYDGKCFANRVCTALWNLFIWLRIMRINTLRLLKGLSVWLVCAGCQILLESVPWHFGSSVKAVDWNSERETYSPTHMVEFPDPWTQQDIQQKDAGPYLWQRYSIIFTSLYNKSPQTSLLREPKQTWPFCILMLYFQNLGFVQVCCFLGNGKHYFLNDYDNVFSKLSSTF